MHRCTSFTILKSGMRLRIGAWRKLNLMRAQPTEQQQALKHCAAVEKSVLNNLMTLNLSRENMLLCVSGGSDSIAMLHIMAVIWKRSKQNYKLAVVNYNHKLRMEADQEEIFVQKIAESYGIPFFSRHLPEELRKETSLQLSSRDWRRQESQKLAAELGQQLSSSGDHPSKYIICTAHTHDDNIETLIMKLLRGVHLSNFQGIKPLLGGFFKPLLSLSKEDLVKYLRIRELEWREDESNLTRKYTRNKVRLDVLPLLEAVAGGKEAFARRLDLLSRQSIDLQEWINKEVVKYETKIKSGESKSPTIPFTLNISPIMRNVKVEAEQMEKVLTLVRQPLPHGKPCLSITLSQQW
eukprot:CAMPEP_0170407026 /NCGR_PEP_ID=MMETSP0117_2-20130122/28031_1 /TAXON_ID=400756 /ORGANISM="Durinskia baltica, Strain CSIRO CS-38" /LENGTH=351 /DNA_ID=CAMNT_0010664253 /DNA_START=82 /DNA_END=1134 /DNA_ORIENTATION=+